MGIHFFLTFDHYPGELHLSHNRIKAHGAVVIVHAADRSRHVGMFACRRVEFMMGK